MNTTEKKAYSINEFCQLFSIGRTKTYDEIKEGRLPIIKIGSRTLIKADDANQWLESLKVSQ